MLNDETKELVLEIYMTMQKIYSAPKPDRPLTKGELMDMVKQEDRIKAASVALSCIDWLANNGVSPCKQGK
jgi:hypothetical protein